MQVQAADAALLDDVDPGVLASGGRSASRQHDADGVVAEDGIAHADDEGARAAAERAGRRRGLFSSLYGAQQQRRNSRYSSPPLRTVTCRGISPGRLCVAQL